MRTKTLGKLAILVLGASAIGCGAAKDDARKKSNVTPAAAASPPVADPNPAPAPAPAGAGTGSASASGADPAPAGSGTGSATGTASDVGTGSASADVPAEPDDPEAFRMGALGDSISRALDVHDFLVESLELSFSTGNGVLKENASHYAHLRNDLALAKVAAQNEAVSGARAEDLAGQVDKLNALKPQYATLLIGANDVCNWPDDHAAALSAYAKDLGAAAAALIAANPGIKLVMIPTPDLNQLYELKKDAANCRNIWALTHFCDGLLAPGLTAAERTAFHQRWLDMNAAAQAVADAHKDNARFAAAVATAVFVTGHVSSVDCFHPSAAGQAFLAEKTWDEPFARTALPKKP